MRTDNLFNKWLKFADTIWYRKFESSVMGIKSFFGQKLRIRVIIVSVYINVISKSFLIQNTKKKKKCPKICFRFTFVTFNSHPPSLILKKYFSRHFRSSIILDEMLLAIVGSLKWCMDWSVKICKKNFLKKYV